MNNNAALSKGSGQAALVRPVRLRAIAGIMALNGGVSSALFAVPLIVALHERHWPLAAGLSIGTLICAGLFGLRRRFVIPDDVTRSEGLVSVALAFLFAPLLLSLAFISAGLSLTDAMFEAMSGLTTTGLTVYGDVEGLAFPVVFLRGWSQWFGGAFFLIGALALVIAPGRIARRIGSAQLDTKDEGLLASTRSRARFVLSGYVLLTVACLVLLWIASGDFVNAMLITFAAVSTGGFSSYNDSLAGLPPAAMAIALFFCVATAVSLMAYVDLRRGNFRAFFGARDFLVLMGLILAVAGLVALAETLRGLPLSQSVPHALATAASAQSTAGFSTTDIAALTDTSKLVLVASMMIGGDVGSTAGGLKIVRLILLAAVFRIVFIRLLSPPSAVTHVRVGGRVISEAEVSAVLALLAIYLMLQLAAWLIFVAAGYAPLDALFEVTSALSTVGLSAGLTSAALEPGLKWILVGLMWLGRVELIAVLIIFMPMTWIRKG